MDITNIPDFVHCAACGMPMGKEEDFGGSDPENDWCRYCCEQDGTHKSFDELVQGQAKFLMTPQGQEISEKIFASLNEAEAFAKEYLSKQPAFENQR